MRRIYKLSAICSFISLVLISAVSDFLRKLGVLGEVISPLLTVIFLISCVFWYLKAKEENKKLPPNILSSDAIQKRNERIDLVFDRIAVIISIPYISYVLISLLLGGAEKAIASFAIFGFLFWLGPISLLTFMRYLVKSGIVKLGIFGI